MKAPFEQALAINRSEISRLRLQVKSHGWDRKATVRILAELASHFALATGGAFVFLECNMKAARVAGLLMSAFGSIGVGTNTHTSSHGGTSALPWLNEVLTYFGMPFFLQLSVTYWKKKHLVLHHPAPNVVGVDDDINLLPFFAVIETEASRPGRFRRIYYCSIQWLVIPFAVALNFFSVQLHSWRGLLRGLSKSELRKQKMWIDLAMMLLHSVTWIGLPGLFFPLRSVLELYLLRTVLMGYGFFLVTAPAHFPEEAVCTQRLPFKPDFVLLQTRATINFRTGVLGRFLCSGLEYQIEHHLFPDISHVHYPGMSPWVREFCEQAGYPYRTLSWGEAIWKSFGVFKRPKPVDRLQAFNVSSSSFAPRRSGVENPSTNPE